MKQQISSLFLLMLSACAAPNLWEFKEIATGEPAFDSARLTYFEPNSSPLRFELIRIDSSIESFLNLTKYKFTRSNEGVCVQFKIGGETVEEMVPLLEGQMRLRFSSELTERVASALKNGSEVAILVDGFEQQLPPDRFSNLYEKLASTAASFQNPFKGPFEP